MESIWERYKVSAMQNKYTARQSTYNQYPGREWTSRQSAWLERDDPSSSPDRRHFTRYSSV